MEHLTVQALADYPDGVLLHELVVDLLVDHQPASPFGLQHDDLLGRRVLGDR